MVCSMLDRHHTETLVAYAVELYTVLLTQKHEVSPTMPALNLEQKADQYP